MLNITARSDRSTGPASPVGLWRLQLGTAGTTTGKDWDAVNLPPAA
jgi:hypothetical protein